MNSHVHRDHAIAGGALALAISDDRVEVWNAGRFPTAITPTALARTHPTVNRNLVIAEVFHRAGLIERWGRGTNRVVEMCRAASVNAPEFTEVAGATEVTFRVPVAMGRGVGPRSQRDPQAPASVEASYAPPSPTVRSPAPGSPAGSATTPPPVG